MLKLGKGVGRAQLKRAFAGRKRPVSFTYTGILREEDIREAIAGIREARTPRWAVPLLAWLAAHPNAPDDVLRELHAQGVREVLMGLALNPKLPSELKRSLLRHDDAEVRDHANHLFSKTKRH